MGTRPDSALRVGILVLAALTVFIVAMLWLPSFWQWGRGHWFIVEFNKAMGLEKGSEVLVQGMRVGTVDDVKLKPPSTVRVVVRLEKPVPVYRPPASHITIRIGTLIGQPYVDIMNRQVGRAIRKGETVRGVDPVSWEELIPQASELAQSLNAVLGVPQVQQDLRSAITDLASAAGSLRALLASVPAEDVRAVTANLRQLVQRLNALASDRRLDEMLSHMETATRQVAGLLSDPRLKRGVPQTVQEAERAVRALRQLLADEGMQRDLKTLAANLRESSESLQALLSKEGAAGELQKTLAEARQAVTAVHDLVGDPEIQTALKTTAKNLAEITGRGHKTMDELEGALKRVRQFMESTQDDLEKVAEHLRGITQDLDETLDAIKWLMTEGGLKENLKQVGENLRVTSENLRVTTQGVRDLLSDEKTQTSLRQGLQEVGPTVAVWRRAAERGQQLLSHLESMTRWQARPSAAVWFMPETSEPRGETWLQLHSPVSPIDLLTGTYTDRKGTRINLQIQGKMGEKTVWRFGGMRSKLGIGLSWGTERLRLDLDAFDPDRWQVNTWLRWQLLPSLLLRFGLEDMGRSRTFGVGLEFGSRR